MYVSVTAGNFVVDGYNFNAFFNDCLSDVGKSYTV